MLDPLGLGGCLSGCAMGGRHVRGCFGGFCVIEVVHALRPVLLLEKLCLSSCVNLRKLHAWLWSVHG